jgi:serine/threonine protein kinase
VVERFYREAQASAALNHPNIVRAHDIDNDGKKHYHVMENHDGTSLQDIVTKQGPLDITRAAHYIAQTAQGLQHAHELGWVHRDIKPGNILLDRSGTVKILDMGLARFFPEKTQSLTQKYDEHAILGTADYLAPEQAVSSHDVDIRADIYSLGGTLYFLLTGQPPFPEGTVTQKLIWQQMREPQSVRELRPDVPAALVTVVEKMMDKAPGKRYQAPEEVIQALEPWTSVPVNPPLASEMPKHCPAVRQLLLIPEGSSTTNLSQRKLPKALSSSSSNSSLITSPVSSSKAATRKIKPGADSEVNFDAPLIPGLTASARILKEGLSSLSTRVRNTGKFVLDTAKVAHGIKMRKRSVAIAMAVAILPLTGFVFWEFVLNDTTPKARPREPLPPQVAKTSTSSPIAASAETPKAVGPTEVPRAAPGVTVADPTAVTSSGRKALLVAEDASEVRHFGANIFPTIAQAVARAQPGDVIRILGGNSDPDGKPLIVREQLVLDGENLPQNLTIEGWHLGIKGGLVEWHPTADQDGKTPIVSLKAVRGLRLRGFKFAGENRLQTLLSVSGHCPGLKLEDLHLHEFKSTGVALHNCTGEREEVSTIRRVRFSCSPIVKGDSILLIEASPDKVSQEMLVSDCRFEGTCEAAVRVAGSVNYIEFLRNRFYKVDSVIYYKKAEPRLKMRLSLVSNTFLECYSVLQFEAAPQAGDTSDNRVTLKANLFSQTQAVARIEDAGADVSKIKALFGALVGNVREPTSCQEGIYFSEIDSRVFEPLSFDPHSDREFLRYPKTSPLALVGVDKTPVGVPPVD